MAALPYVYHDQIWKSFYSSWSFLLRCIESRRILPSLPRWWVTFWNKWILCSVGIIFQLLHYPNPYIVTGFKSPVGRVWHFRWTRHSHANCSSRNYRALYNPYYRPVQTVFDDGACGFIGLNAAVFASLSCTWKVWFLTQAVGRDIPLYTTALVPAGNDKRVPWPV